MDLCSLSPSQNKAVARWLAQNSERPQKAMLLWAELFDRLRRDTGQIMLSRDELAQLLGEHPSNVSKIMGELGSIGAVITRRERVRLRGPARSSYFMNPNVATNLSGAARDRAQASSTAPASSFKIRVALHPRGDVVSDGTRHRGGDAGDGVRTIAGDGRWLPLGVAAPFLGISRSSVYGRLRRGTLASRPLGNKGLEVLVPDAPHDVAGNGAHDGRGHGAGDIAATLRDELATARVTIGRLG